jgi:hypothetical protein
MIIITDIISRMQVSPAELQILHTIAKNGNVFGQNSRTSYSYMAGGTGYSERYCKALEKRLETRHLLRVERRVIKPGLNAINVYSIVRPWLKELSYHEAYINKLRRQRAKEDTAHLSSDRGCSPKGETREKKKQQGFLPVEEIPGMFTEGDHTWYYAQGLDPPQA